MILRTQVVPSVNLHRQSKVEDKYYDYIRIIIYGLKTKTYTVV